MVAPAALAVEVFIALAIWFPRTRLAAIWVAAVFHLSIEIAASVQTFSYSAIAALLIWVTPTTSDRTVTASPRLNAVVTRLDWLHRFRVVAGHAGSATVLVDRDGTVRVGRDATLTTLSRLPLLFLVVAPLLAVHRLTAVRNRAVRLR